LPGTPACRVGAASRTLARVALRGVVLAGGVIAGVLLVSGLASAATDDPEASAPQSSHSGSTGGSPLITLNSSRTPLTSAVAELTAGVTRVVSVATTPVLPEVQVDAQAVELPASGVAVVADLGSRPAAPTPTAVDRPVVAGDRRNATASASHLAVPVPSRHEAVVSWNPLSGSADSAGSAGSAEVLVPAPAPSSPEPAPMRLDMPCAPVPAPPAPASQPSTVNAVEAVPVHGPARGCMRVPMVRTTSQRPIAIAEEPGSTPD
jgi:hypothetical protein